MDVLAAITDDRLAKGVNRIAAAIDARGGSARVVGGAVRDAMLGLPVADVDLEVYGLEPDVVRETVGALYKLSLVGEAFAVLKVVGLDIDVALPRRESKTGVGHTGFTVLSDPHMDPAEAASRRDFTINAMSVDPLTGELYDYFGGAADLERRVLRHVSDAFDEDPLRVMRGAQFAARFSATMAPETIAKCRTLELEGLAAERLFTEWRKLIVDGVVPSRGLDVLDDTGWLRFFPELDALKGVEQDPTHHPEGDVWIHTRHVVDAYAAERSGDRHEDEVVGFAALCHDLGKPATTAHIDGKWRAHSHDREGVAPTRAFLGGLRAPHQLVDDVSVLVAHHLAPAAYYAQGAKRPAVRRLAAKVGRLDRLVRVARADAFGRPPLPSESFPAGDWMLEMAASMNITSSRPVPLVTGKLLIGELGLTPGPHFKEILDACFDAQLDERITTVDEGLDLARGLIGS